MTHQLLGDLLHLRGALTRMPIIAKQQIWGVSVSCRVFPEPVSRRTARAANDWLSASSIHRPVAASCSVISSAS
jgi:hypothetical protein